MNNGIKVRAGLYLRVSTGGSPSGRFGFSEQKNGEALGFYNFEILWNYRDVGLRS